MTPLLNYVFLRSALISTDGLCGWGRKILCTQLLGGGGGKHFKRQRCVQLEKCSAVPPPVTNDCERWCDAVSVVDLPGLSCAHFVSSASQILYKKFEQSFSHKACVNNHFLKLIIVLFLIEVFLKNFN